MNINKKRKALIGGIVVLALLVVLPFVSADNYELFCLAPGETIDLGALCNPAMSPRTGPLNLCMHQLDNGKLCPANLNVCNGLGLTCGETSNTTVDSQAPGLEIISPQEGDVYSERRILLVLDASESASIKFRDNNDPSGRWTNVCSSCSFHSRERSFEEGLNDLTFRVSDSAGNEAFYDVSFRVDSKDPKIKNTEPTGGFASGEFFAEIDEDNLERVTLFYGVFGDMRSKEVDLVNECFMDRNWECTTNVELSDFDGQQISYYFEAEDIAGVIDTSDEEDLTVDDTDPVIVDFNFDKNGKHVTFMIEVDEPNFDEIIYYDSLNSRPKWKRLCSKLVNGVCNKKISFKDGPHALEIKVVDEAGHETSHFVNIVTDSKVPKIKDIEPSRGFVSGFFEVEFDEMNPETVLFRYGNLFSGFEDYEIDVASECLLNRNYECAFNVDVGEYNNEEIEARLIVVDEVGNIGEDREDGLKVDVVAPVITALDYVVDGDRAEVVIRVDERNLEEITYRNNQDNHPKEKRFCSRLSSGECEKRIKLNEGQNLIDFMVYDEAGSAVAESLDIFLIEN